MNVVLEPHHGGVRIRVEPAARRMGCVTSRTALPGHPTVREAFADEIAELRLIAARISVRKPGP